MSVTGSALQATAPTTTLRSVVKHMFSDTLADNPVSAIIAA